jgi:hypothetical protein
LLCIEKVYRLHYCLTPKPLKMKQDSGLIIGFSGTYYCLWSWWYESNYAMTGSGNYVATDSYTKYAYIKRISTDVNKVKELYPNIPIDMNLHGQSWDSEKKGKKEPLPYDVFPYGFKGERTKIMECDEAKLLWALYLKCVPGTGRNKVYARRRLVELGYLVPYKTVKIIEVGNIYNSTDKPRIIRNSYASPHYVAKLEFEKSMVRGHFFENGKRVNLMLKKGKSFSFETNFGICYIVEYVDAENRVFKYKGNTPPYFENNNEFTEVKATIKHGNYKGQDETLIQRISITK